MRFPCKVKNNSGPKIVTWAGGTDEEIAAMLEAHYNGDIDIHDYWTVGDQRTVTLSAMSATGVSESHVQQSVVYVLANSGGLTLADGVTECAFQVDQKDCLLETGNMDSTEMSSWKNCARRTWCNSVYKNALPATFRNIFKEFIYKVGKDGSTTTDLDTLTDYFALRANIEITGTNNYVAGQTVLQYCIPGEGTQASYYTVSSNQKKVTPTASSLKYWLRSPMIYWTASSTNFNQFLLHDNNSGNPTQRKATDNAWYLAPFGVI